MKICILSKGSDTRAGMWLKNIKGNEQKDINWFLNCCITADESSFIVSRILTVYYSVIVCLFIFVSVYNKKVNAATISSTLSKYYTRVSN
jgi:hypothetical protein